MERRRQLRSCFVHSSASSYDSSAQIPTFQTLPFTSFHRLSSNSAQLVKGTDAKRSSRPVQGDQCMTRISSNEPLRLPYLLLSPTLDSLKPFPFLFARFLSLSTSTARMPFVIPEPPDHSNLIRSVPLGLFCRFAAATLPDKIHESTRINYPSGYAVDGWLAAVQGLEVGGRTLDSDPIVRALLEKQISPSGIVRFLSFSLSTPTVLSFCCTL